MCVPPLTSDSISPASSFGCAQSHLLHASAVAHLGMLSHKCLTEQHTGVKAYLGT